jgi:hypothetical protein
VKQQDSIKLKWSEKRKENKNKTDKVGFFPCGLVVLTNDLSPTV